MRPADVQSRNIGRGAMTWAGTVCVECSGVVLGAIATLSD